MILLQQHDAHMHIVTLNVSYALCVSLPHLAVCKRQISWVHNDLALNTVIGYIYLLLTVWELIVIYGISLDC